MRVPSSTPAGIVTCKLRSLVTRPWPPHELQGSLITWPRPAHVGQARSTVKKPDCERTAPAPPQVPQVFGWVPGLAPEPLHGSQVTDEGTRTVAVFPVKASVRLISKLNRKSLPRWAEAPARPLRARCPPPAAPRCPPIKSPNKSSKISDIEELNSGPNPAPPGRCPPPFSKAAWPKRS